MGYHQAKIEKGVLGEVSKIQEEFEEFKDANTQGNVVMELVELSDMLGAIEAYLESIGHLTLQDLIVMKDATKSAFKDGSRI